MPVASRYMDTADEKIELRREEIELEKLKILQQNPELKNLFNEDENEH